MIDRGQDLDKTPQSSKYYNTIGYWLIDLNVTDKTTRVHILTGTDIIFHYYVCSSIHFTNSESGKIYIKYSINFTVYSINYSLDCPYNNNNIKFISIIMIGINANVKY